MENQQEGLHSFLQLIHSDPPAAWVEKTPDGNASTVNISFVEMALDMAFSGLWGTRNFTSKVIANEVVGELELYYIHPITKTEFSRVGAAAIQIMVDKIPDEVKISMSKQQINLHALDPANKKSNALDLAYPKLKAECLKNAAVGIGKLFGRDLNRKRKAEPVGKLQQATDELVKQISKMITEGRDLGALSRAQLKGIVFDELQLAVLQEALDNKQKELA